MSRRARAAVAALALAGAGLGAAAPAVAQDPAPGTTEQAGGTSSTPPPLVRSIRCRTLCSGPVHARSGSLVVLRGRGLETVRTVVFLGRSRTGDEVVAQADRAKPHRVYVRVPESAATGPVAVTTGDDVASPPSRGKVRVEVVRTRRVAGTGGPAIDVAVTGRKVFIGGARRPTLTFAVHDDQPAHAVVQVVRVADAAVVAQWDQGTIPPGEERVLSWNGLVEGQPAPDGRYEFRVVADDGRGVTASTSQAPPQDADAPPSPDSFMLLGHKFPVRGPHDYGGEQAHFGGGRGHQGHDVFAKCGTPLVAARGGRIKLKRWHERAGHYVVIDGDGTDVDYIYMHLRDPARVDQGDKVRTGQLIGHVGDTGRAFGCHLHFELWSGPGWYTGGSPFDPLPHLQAWDAVS